MTNYSVPINTSIDKNLNYIKDLYSAKINKDLYFRDFIIYSEIKACIVFFDGLVDRDLVTSTILDKLMTPLYFKDLDNNIEDLIYNTLLPQMQVKKVTTFTDVVSGINIGECAIFIENLNVVFMCDVKQWEHRPVSETKSEVSLRGPQEGFVEILKTNISLVRKIIRSEDLIVEYIPVGTTYRNDCALMYIRNIANESLIDEIKTRLGSIQAEYVAGTGDLEQLIEDKHYYFFPQTLATERPDRVAGSLIEGRISLMVNGSPYALILPISILDTIYSNDDDIIRSPYKVFLKIVRMMALMITLFLPCLFIAAVNFHHDLIPTNLLLTMAAIKEKVPFPFSLEIIFMILVYEIAQESRLRIPSQLGSVIGLVGSLILGQSAVTANIISPITIIITSISILTSLTIPDYYISSGFRLLRLLFVFGSMCFGFLGISLALYGFLLYTFHLRPFKVPLIQPFYIDRTNNVIKRLFAIPLHKIQMKPYSLPQSKTNKKRPKYSN